MLQRIMGENRHREKIYIEFLRVLASLLTMYFFLGDTVDTAIGNSIFELSKKSACNFFMISGCVLLEKKESLKDVWIKRVLRIGIIILGVNFVILVYRRDFDVFSWHRKILYNDVNPYLRFLYVYVAAMVCLPFLRKMAYRLSSKMFLYILILGIGWKIILDICNVAGIVYPFYLNALFAIVDAMFYMLIGYWVENVVDISKDDNYVDVCLSIIIGISVLSYFVMRLHLLDDLVFVSAFLLVKSLFQKYPPSEKGAKVICFGGSLTFGIYLLTGPLQILAVMIKTVLWKAHSLGSLIPTIIGALVLFILYGLIVTAFKRIPWFGRIVEWFI